MKDAGYNTESLFEYTALQVSVSGAGIDEAGAGYALTTAVGTPTTINVSAQGGTLGGRELRVVQVRAALHRRPVLEDSVGALSADLHDAQLASARVPP